MEKYKNDNWFKKHIDTVIILGAFATSVLWMNHQFNGIDSRFSSIEKDLAVIKTILVMKNIMPAELAHCDKIEERVKDK